MKTLPLLILAILSATGATAQPFNAHLATAELGDNWPWSGYLCPSSLSCTQLPSVQEYSNIKFADVNGDGFPDLCVLAAFGIDCALYQHNSSGGGFGPLQRWSTAFTAASPAGQSYWGTIQYGDVNGDGKADLCGRQPSGFFCYLSDGTKFNDVFMKANFFSDANGWASDPSYWSTIRLVDVNGDHKHDVCGRAPSSPGLKSVFGF